MRLASKIKAKHLSLALTSTGIDRKSSSAAISLRRLQKGVLSRSSSAGRLQGMDRKRRRGLWDAWRTSVYHNKGRSKIHIADIFLWKRVFDDRIFFCNLSGK